MSSLMRGTIFEVEVATFLSDIPDCTVLCDLSVYSPSFRENTQVDVLVVAPWGGYCIEAKGYRTMVRGTFNQKWWTGSTYSNSNEFFNPIIQNFEHIRAVNFKFFERGLAPVSLHNYTVVRDSCEIVHDSDMVVNLTDLSTIILSDSVHYKNSFDVENFLKVVNS